MPIKTFMQYLIEFGMEGEELPPVTAASRTNNLASAHDIIEEIVKKHKHDLVRMFKFYISAGKVDHSPDFKQKLEDFVRSANKPSSFGDDHPVQGSEKGNNMDNVVTPPSADRQGAQSGGDGGGGS